MRTLGHVHEHHVNCRMLALALGFFSFRVRRNSLLNAR